MSDVGTPSPSRRLSPEADLHFTRGMLHLRRGEAILPRAMSVREDQVPPGTDVLMALLGLAAVATSRAFGQTEWIEQYRSEMREALAHFDRALPLAPEFPELHYRRAQALRYLGENDFAVDAARRAAVLEPANEEFASLLRLLETGVTRREQQQAQQARGHSDDPNRPLNWDDIVLPARTKRELRQLQLVLEDPDEARALGIEPPTGLLLYGPPGTGKTTVARILAAQTRARFLTTSAAEINQMWVGESEKSVQKLFAEARAHAPAVIFLDEIDALVPIRAGGVHLYSDKVVNQFLHEMDGLVQNKGVFVIGATNRPDMLDPALIRGGRLSRQIEIPLPELEGRIALLQLMVRRARLSPDVDVVTLASQTEGFSGADLRALVNEAGFQALIRIKDQGGARALTGEDFAYAIANLRRG
ncbi:MAG TPA: ATP-binding protein [Armatimonadaceae bacterium]|nr:ATP-binding protein [Armatimonadaceae bacterium]